MLFKVFMDTNIYEGANFSFYNLSFRSMREYAQKNELSIVINPVIEGEVRAHIEEKVGESIRMLNKLTKNGAFAFFRNLQPYADILERQDPQKWIEVCNTGFTTLLADCNAEHIPVDGICVEKIVRDYFEHNPPFECKKPNEFKDAIAVASLLADIYKTLQLPQNGSEIVYCVVSNDKGFRDAVEVGLDKDTMEKVRVFDKLNSFVKYIAQTSQQTDFLSAFLLSKYWQDQLIETVRYAIDETTIDIVLDDGVFIDEQEILDVDEIKFIPYVLRLYEEDNVPATAVVMLDVDYHLKVWYKYIDEENSYWDKEEGDYLFKAEIKKEGTYHVNYSMVISLDISDCSVPEDWTPNTEYDLSNKSVVFNDYLETPTEVRLDTDNLVDEKVIEQGTPPYIYEDHGELFLDKPYTRCSDCGTPICIHNDGGNRYCIICAPKH